MKNILQKEMLQAQFFFWYIAFVFWIYLFVT